VGLNWVEYGFQIFSNLFNMFNVMSIEWRGSKTIYDNITTISISISLKIYIYNYIYINKYISISILYYSIIFYYILFYSIFYRGCIEDPCIVIPPVSIL